MKFRLFVFIVVIFAVTGCSTIGIKSSSDLDNARKTALLYNEFIKGGSPNIAQLNLFFSKMPKGGDIHHHYSGSIYAETYLDWAKKANYRINKKTLKTLRPPFKDGDGKPTPDFINSISVEDLRRNKSLYRKLLTIWSNKDYQNHYHTQPPPDLNFFNTFGYFGSVSGVCYNTALKVLKKRAIQENVSYIETMFKRVGYSYEDEIFDKKIRKAITNKAVSMLLDKLTKKIDSEDAVKFQKAINKLIKTIKSAHKGIDDNQFMMRYQAYVTRNKLPSVVFSKLYSSFKAADSSELIVGVNIVGPENRVVALADYKLHMLMFAYLKKKFPNVNRALHAGELTLGMVRPKDLTFHISQALHVAGAQRIGHAIDLPYEESISLLKEIKEKSVIEICFTSNEFILGVKGGAHPYLIYSAYNVPIVICTDDSGVSRNNLSNEYVLLATRYKPSYKTVKKYVYNSIKYSFLYPKDKDLLTNSLDTRFKKFEAKMAKYYNLIRIK